MVISAGASVLSVQRLLGHSSSTVTLSVYSSLFEDDLDEVAERLDSMRRESDVPILFPNWAQKNPPGWPVRVPGGFFVSVGSAEWPRRSHAGGSKPERKQLPTFARKR